MILGADIGGTAVKFVLRAPGGEAALREEVPTDPQSPRLTLQRLADRLAALGYAPDAVTAVGLACAGIVSPAGGRLGRAPNLPGWEHTSLAEPLRAVFGDRPAAFANDVNAALVGESRLGAGRGARDVVMLALGTGVGGAVMVAGRLVTGAHDGAGEIGHMVVDPEGPVCTCGNRGCLEAFAGARALTAAARRRARSAAAGAGLRRLVRERGEQLSPRDLAAAAADGDPDAREIYALAGDRLGLAVGNLINVLDPERVVIGGGVARAGALILDPCRRRAVTVVLGEHGRRTPIVPAELGPWAAALGAALLAEERERPT